MGENMNGLYLDLIVHPGETIKEVLEDRNMSQEELATRTGFSAKHISEVIRGKKNISSKFANRLEYALNISTEFWINLQGIYDKEILELENANNITKEEFNKLNELKDIVDYCKELKIINENNNKSITVLNMRKFLNLNDLTAIPNLPLQQVAFRGSKKNKINLYVLYSWQKICEYITEKEEINNKFNKEKLNKKYNNIKKTMFLEPNEMIKELKKIFAECGICFEVVKHFKGAPVNGFIKKKNNKIILCMTIRQNFADIFWFTLFHEICHLLNDDFNNQFIDYNFIDSETEKKADIFARDILINKKDYENFISINKLNYQNIKKFAKKQNVIPGIVIGRIQNDKQDFSFMTKYRKRYKWVEQ